MPSESIAAERARRKERFSRLPGVLGMVLGLLALLAALYPKQLLHGMLDRCSAVSPAVLCYRESILRLHPDDLELRLKLAEELVSSGHFPKALEVLEECSLDDLSRPMLARVHEIRCLALKGWVLSLPMGDPARDRLAGDFAREIRSLVATQPAPEVGRRMVWEALAIGDQAIAHFLRERFETAEEALSRGDYRKSAELFFRQMARARELSIRRELFQKGVSSLESGDLVTEALEMAEAHLEDLASDRPTCLFLARLALAAGRLDRAQVYIKKALGMTPS